MRLLDFTIPCLAFLMCGCHFSQGSAEKDVNSSFDAALAHFEQNADSNAQENSDAELNSLLALAAKTDWGQAEDIEWAVISRYPDSALSIGLLNRATRRGFGDTASVPAPPFIDRIIDELPGTRVSRAAFYMKLDNLISEDPAEFRAYCDRSIELGESDFRAPIALFRRFEFYSQRGDWKPAFADLWRFVATYRDKAANMNLQSSLAAAARRAGFELEAESVERKGVGLDAARIFGDLSRLVRTGGEHHEKIAKAVWVYWTYAPDTRAMDRASQELDDSDDGYAMLLCRTAVLDLRHGEASRALNRIHKLVDLYKLVDFDSFDQAGCEQHRLAGLILLHVLADCVRSVDPSTRREVLEVQSQIAGSTLEATAIKCRLGSDTTSETCVEAIDGIVHELVHAENFAAAISLYELAATETACATCVPAFLIGMGEIHKDHLRNSRVALDLFRRVRERYPNSVYRSRALGLEASMLIRSGNYRDAYVILHEQKVDRTDPYAPAVLFLRTVSESNLGLTEESRETVQTIIEDYPSAAVAPRALYSLALTFLARQEYSDAGTYLEEIVTRYPDSKEANEALRLRQRLEQIQQ